MSHNKKEIKECKFMSKRYLKHPFVLATSLKIFDTIFIAEHLIQHLPNYEDWLNNYFSYIHQVNKVTVL